MTEVGLSGSAGYDGYGRPPGGGISTERVAELVGHGADPNARSRFGLTPLWIAVETRQAGAVAALLRHGARANCRIRGPGALESTLLMRATDDPAISEMLIGAGADVNAATAIGRTVLMDAVRHRDAETVAVLLRHGANPRATDRLRRTALDYARTALSKSPPIARARCEQTIALLAAAMQDHARTPR